MGEETIYDSWEQIPKLVSFGVTGTFSHSASQLNLTTKKTDTCEYLFLPSGYHSIFNFAVVGLFILV